MTTTPATPVRRILDKFLCQGTIEAVDTITRRMRRIRITGESLRGLDWIPGQHIRLQVGDLIRDFRDALRTYSIWAYDDRGHLDLCVFDHPGTGPGVRWSRQVRIGQRVAFTHPEGRLVIQDNAPYHLFVGDETASAAFGAMLRALSASARVHAALEVDAPDDRLPLPRSGEFTWVYRNATSQAQQLAEASMRVRKAAAVTPSSRVLRACCHLRSPPAARQSPLRQPWRPTADSTTNAVSGPRRPARRPLNAVFRNHSRCSWAMSSRPAPQARAMRSMSPNSRGTLVPVQ